MTRAQVEAVAAWVRDRGMPEMSRNLMMLARVHLSGDPKPEDTRTIQGPERQP
ncbi:hypothetical protein UFOVP747_39 [uncultured Caudovirales phage]|uniref:Uncharacterized protein n=1 Tax=uncultured Caudovirales phage TaxID=2100421 RepID=A0A6J5NEC7_9CAUD|nr:hypothetical protein UFOVP675_60 [uncultured Caudovirales phage]CAB5225510.1 hypothetical protein UFOVP747_39 [uncultured Caudovirales phage]